jgi:uncharacterized protein HemX
LQAQAKGLPEAYETFKTVISKPVPVAQVANPPKASTTAKTNTPVARLSLKRNPLAVAAATIVVVGALGVAGIGVAIALGYVASFAFLATLSLPTILVVAGLGAGVGVIAGLAMSAYNTRQEYKALKAELAQVTTNLQAVSGQVQEQVDVPAATSTQAPVAKTSILSRPKFMATKVVPMVELPAKQPAQKLVARNEFDLKGYGLKLK